jgi:hypothetical protein
VVIGVNKEELKYCAEYFNRQKGRPYPCSNQTVVCAVITMDRDKALSAMKEKGAIIRRQSFRHIEWELNNEIWLWKNWNTDYRGYRFYKVIVDEDIDDRIFRWVNAYACLYCCSMEII